MTQKNFGAFTYDGFGQLLQLCGSQFGTMALTGPLPIPSLLLTGALDINLFTTSAAPGTLTTPSAAQLYADIITQFGLPLPLGFSYKLTITNTGAGTMTLAGGTGVTITGTATIPTLTTRTFLVTFTPGGFTFTAVGTGTYS